MEKMTLIFLSWKKITNYLWETKMKEYMDIQKTKPTKKGTPFTRKDSNYHTLITKSLKSKSKWKHENEQGTKAPWIPFHSPKHPIVPLTPQINKTIHTPQQANETSLLPKKQIEEEIFHHSTDISMMNTHHILNVWKKESQTPLTKTQRQRIWSRSSSSF